MTVNEFIQIPEPFNPRAVVALLYTYDEDAAALTYEEENDDIVDAEDGILLQ